MGRIYVSGCRLSNQESPVKTFPWRGAGSSKSRLSARSGNITALQGQRLVKASRRPQRRPRAHRFRRGRTARPGGRQDQRWADVYGDSANGAPQDLAAFLVLGPAQVVIESEHI